MQKLHFPLSRIDIGKRRTVDRAITGTRDSIWRIRNYSPSPLPPSPAEAREGSCERLFAKWIALNGSGGLESRRRRPVINCARFAIDEIAIKAGRVARDGRKRISPSNGFIFKSPGLAAREFRSSNDRRTRHAKVHAAVRRKFAAGLPMIDRRRAAVN